MTIFRFALLCFLLNPLRVQTQPGLKAVAESVLDKLYLVNGNRIYPKPAIEIDRDERQAARFVRRTNTIEVGVKIFEVCRVFGKDSLSALAFILGHELAHAFQPNTVQTGFLAYDRGESGDANAEKDADVQGLFNAWLAGYNTTDLLPYIIEGLYVAYDLKGKNLPRYPSLDERKLVAQEVRLLVTELMRMYETGNYLIAIGQYDLAAACFRSMEPRYKGREVYQNLGISMVLQAINISEKNVDPYVFPLEPDCNTRLQKTKTGREPADLTPGQWQKRGELLAGAASCFERAGKMDNEYMPAEINYMCALVLNAKSAEAIEYCEKRALMEKARLLDSPRSEQDKVKLVRGLAYAYSRRLEAIAMFEELINSPDDFVKYAAGINAAVMSGNKPEIRETITCQIAFETDVPIDDVQLQRPATAAWTMLDNNVRIEVCTVLNPHSDLLVFRVSGQDRFSLQRIHLKGEAPAPSSIPNRNAVTTHRGNIVVCSEKNVALLVSKTRKKTLEWAKYYEFK